MNNNPQVVTTTKSTTKTLVGWALVAAAIVAAAFIARRTVWKVEVVQQPGPGPIGSVQTGPGPIGNQ